MRLPRKGDSGLSLPLFALAHLGIFAGLFRGLYSINVSGTGLYYDYAGRVLAGQLPYRDFPVEYPPLALVLFAVPRMLGESFRWYYVWFQTEVVLCDLVMLAVLFAAARRYQWSPWRVLGVYTVAVLAVGPINLQQYDIFPALFTLIAVLAFAREREGTAGVFLALGVMAKIYPLLLAPVFLIDDWRRGRRRPIARALGAFVATCAICLAPWLLAPRSLGVLIGYHAQRGIQIESIWASVSFIARWLGWSWVDTNKTFGSWNVSGPLPDMLVGVSTLALVLALIAAYWWSWRRPMRDTGEAGAYAASVSRAVLVVLLASLAASKVFSPQYLVWLTPFVGLIERDRQTTVLVLFVVAGLLTAFVSPFHYRDLLDRRAVPIAALTIRNVIIVALPFLLARGDRATAAIA